MRTLWFVAGAGAGVYVMLRARRAAEALTPEGWHDRAAGVQLGWQMFSDEVRAGMAEKETELRERLLTPPDGERRLLSSGGSGPDGQQ
ncbi:DUF6167 family protein [Nocardioides mangrovicus]|uniref:DUF6167 family protein n=1 Tax=Nocardioides mangrovicus TaxID=2478913 RepID=UPI0018E09D6D|nr:DUF6167 family protein [Nocardioides mangrovicus]